MSPPYPESQVLWAHPIFVISKPRRGLHKQNNTAGAATQLTLQSGTNKVERTHAQLMARSSVCHTCRNAHGLVLKQKEFQHTGRTKMKIPSITPLAPVWPQPQGPCIMCIRTKRLEGIRTSPSIYLMWGKKACMKAKPARPILGHSN